MLRKLILVYEKHKQQTATGIVRCTATALNVNASVTLTTMSSEYLRVSFIVERHSSCAWLTNSETDPTMCHSLTTVAAAAASAALYQRWSLIAPMTRVLLRRRRNYTNSVR